MIFAYIDDGTLDVLADLADARRRYAGPDIEDGVVRLFDERGAPLGVTYPSAAGDHSRAYDLRPDVSSGSELLAVVLDEVNVLMANPWFPEVDDVRAHLAT
jgi:hypothetical protein